MQNGSDIERILRKLICHYYWLKAPCLYLPFVQQKQSPKSSFFFKKYEINLIMTPYIEAVTQNV